MRGVSRIVTAASLFALAVPQSSEGAVVAFIPPSGASRQQVAANLPVQNSIWAGIAQSVTAVDSNVTFGFYFTGSAPSSVMYTLRSGDGPDGSILKQVTSQIPMTNFDPVLVIADFSDISLAVGQKYTFEASLPGGAMPATGSTSASYASYAGVNDPYPGGRFYFAGANYDQEVPAISNRDLAFSMAGVSAAVPEPATWAMMLIGFGAMGFAMRRERRRVAGGGFGGSPDKKGA